MTTLTRLGLGVLLSLTLSLPVWAAEGDLVDQTNRGDLRYMRFLLCDGATGGATKDCAEFDTNQAAQVGQPIFAAIYIRENATQHSADSCSGTPAVTVRGYDDSASDLTNVLKHQENDGTTLSTSGDSMVVLDPPLHRYYDAAIASGTGCTDFEVVIKLVYDRREN